MEGRNKLGTDAFCADDIDVFAVCLDGFFYDRKSQAGALLILAAGKVCFVKAFPNLIQRTAGDPDPIVFYRDVDLFSALCGFNGDSRLRVAEFDGIVQQIVENLVDLTLVGIDLEMFGGKQKFNRDFF